MDLTSKALGLYYKEIKETNEKIGKGLSWAKYAKKFKKVNPRLYIALHGVELRRVKNEYLRNWIRNLITEKENE